MTPEPETLASIQAQGTVGTSTVHSCGCEYRTKWHLCTYHCGFEDGLEAARRTESLQADST